MVPIKTIKVTSKGQITIPIQFREELQILAGDYLEATVKDDGLFLKPLPKSDFQEVVREYCQEYRVSSDDLEQTREILDKVPFSLAERVGKLREEEQ